MPQPKVSRRAGAGRVTWATAFSQAVGDIADRRNGDRDRGSLGCQGPPDGVDLAGKCRLERDDRDAVDRPASEPWHDGNAQSSSNHRELGLVLLSGMGHLGGQPVLTQRLGQPFVTDRSVGPGDPRLVTEFGELDARTLCEGMISSYGKINRVVHDQQAPDAVRQYQWRIHPVVDQGNVDMSCGDQADCFIRLPLRNPKPQLFMFLAQPGDGLGKYGPRGGGESGDLQITDDALAFPVELTFSALDLREDCVRAPRQQHPCRREPYAAAIWLNQPLAHIALQLAELL